MGDMFTIGHVAQLHEIQKARLRRNLPGIGKKVEKLISDLTAGGVASPHSIEIERIARRMWDTGLARHTETSSFEGYLASIPPIPYELIEENEEFPLLVLVDYRVFKGKTFGDFARLVGIAAWHGRFLFRNNIEGIRWIRCQDGTHRRGSVIAKSSEMESERHMRLEEGMFLALQHPRFLKTHYIACAATDSYIYGECRATMDDGSENYQRVGVIGDDGIGPIAVRCLEAEFRVNRRDKDQGIATVWVP